MTGSKWAKSKDEPRLKMDQESKWTKDQDQLLFFTPLKSRHNSEQQPRNKLDGQNGPRVKMDKESK